MSEAAPDKKSRSARAKPMTGAAGIVPETVMPGLPGGEPLAPSAVEAPSLPPADVMAAAPSAAPEPREAPASLAPVAEPETRPEPEPEPEPEAVQPVSEKIIEAAASPAVQSDPIPAGPETLAPNIEEVTDMATIPSPTATAFAAGDTATAATAETSDKMQAMFGDMSARFKAAIEKSQKLGEELVELTKGNVEAMVASAKVAAKGGEAIGQDVGEYGRKSLEAGITAMKSMASVKSPTELFQLQSEYVKSSFDSAVAEASKLSEALLKIAGEAAQPLSSRYAVAAEKIKAATV